MTQNTCHRGKDLLGQKSDCKTFRKIPARQGFLCSLYSASFSLALSFIPGTAFEQQQTWMLMLILIFIDYRTLPRTIQKQIEEKKESLFANICMNFPTHTPNTEQASSQWMNYRAQ
jgi:hypothetical protein